MTDYGNGGIVSHGSSGSPVVGVHRSLDDAATELIRKSLEGVTSMEAKRDVLTPWKEKDRRDREVLSASGVPDASTRSGMYHRAWNSRDTHLNSRDGIARGSRFGTLKEFVDGHAQEGLSQHLGEAGFD